MIPIRHDHTAAPLLPIKAVPGAKRDEIAGPLGQRLKVRTSAPPERGKANQAIIKLIAGILGLRPKQVTIVEGQSSPEKLVRIEGINEATLRQRLGI